MAEKKKKPIKDETPVDAVAADAPAAEELVVEQPVAEPVIDEPVAESVIEETPEAPVAEVEPAVEVEPVAEELVVEQPVAEAIVDETPEAPVAEAEPEVEEPVADEPVAEQPVADEPTAEAEPVKPEVATPAETPVEIVAAVEAPAPAAELAPVQQSVPKPKKKRLPRALRPQKGRPVRAKSETRKTIVRLEKPEHERGRSQERQGTVISDAMEKTIVVKVDTIKAHRKYKKVVRRSNTFHVHDERNEAKVGDVVRIVETRPLSKTKRWRLAEIVEAAK